MACAPCIYRATIVSYGLMRELDSFFLSFPFLSFLLPREDGIFLIRSGLLCAQHGIFFLCVVGCRMRYIRCLLDSDPESRMGRVQTVGAALGMFQPEVGA